MESIKHHKINVEVSARHVHLTQETVSLLFGEGFELSVKKNLSLEGEFLSNQKVSIRGPKATIHNVSVLGPCREQNQIEVSLTDARTLGIDVPIRLSGDLDDSAPVDLETSSNSVSLDKGLIVAKRHLHTDPDTAELYGINHGDSISVKLLEDSRNLVFDDVIVRIGKRSIPVIHLDTDEGNSANIKESAVGYLVIDRKEDISYESTL
ncbi:phosphate propanoyltransferase [Erysipelothrix sp. HDW6A]|uniref:phosphate propanoyltransferase n=1 Tax=Erysipelothrix sp. HDW6A TaxID=2714928 RepID=UPI00140E3CE6|nr:phosphate propanoyltransferase [Erysipelothrix sp. HDW6A]QIK56711.1 phosphate propanoyltransferase [Erysipelothrix sp. HDW6A]